MEFVATSWYILTQLKLDQTIRNLISGDLEIPLMVIQLGVTRLKMTRLVHLLDLSVGRGEKGWLDLVCVKHLQMIWLIVVLLIPFSRMVSMVLVPWSSNINRVTFQKFDIRHKLFQISTLNVQQWQQWPNGQHFKLQLRQSKKRREVSRISNKFENKVS